MTKNQLKILEIMYNSNRENYYYYSFLEKHTKIDKKTLQKEMKDLYKLGLMDYQRGLMNEEGEVAGSGIQITYGRAEEVKKILEDNNMKIDEYYD